MRARQKSPSLRDAAYRIIKHQIITCVLKPGESINEMQMSAALGLGRTPVHQALDRLMVEGMVDVLPRKGVVVRPISLDELMQISEVRLLMETHCARCAAERATPAEIAQLRAILETFEAPVRQRDIEQMILLDREFHAAVVHAGRNDVLEDILLKVNDRSLRFWFVSLSASEQPTAVLREHRAIFDAIRLRRPEAAEAAMRAHIESFRANVASHS